MNRINIDFETRSVVDLKRRGVYSYAQHPTTDAWCMAYAINDSEPDIWRLGDPFPDVVLQYMLDAERDGWQRFEMRAWNAMFERIIWNLICVPRYKFPRLPMEVWHCTAAEAAAMGLPRALESAAEVLRVPHKKDVEGWKLAVRMMRPRSYDERGEPIWWDLPDRKDRLYEYCKGDVRSERDVLARVQRPIPAERAAYLLDQRVNDRGLLIDVPLATAAKKMTKLALDKANEQVRAITGGRVTKVTQVQKLTTWLTEQGAYGLGEPGLGKDIVRDLLAGPLPDATRLALEARAEAGRSSVDKIDTMLTARCDDDRVRGGFLFNGASTGRWSGKLIQPQNFPRPGIKKVERFIPFILADDYDTLDTFGPPAVLISYLLRGMIRARDGHRFVVCDFAQIEARVLAWLAGQDDLVALFANKGPVYETFAADLYSQIEGRKILPSEIGKDDPRRQFGKNMVLGCGYQMGADRYQEQAKEQMGIEITDAFAQTTIDTYRKRVPKIKQLWYDLNAAAIDAVKFPGKIYEVRRCKFVKRGAWLWLILPSGRPLAYAGPKVVVRPVHYPAKACDECREPLSKQHAEGKLRVCPKCQHKSPGETVSKEMVAAWGVNSMTHSWSSYMLYGGLLTENIVQALSRDLLRDAMFRCENDKLPVVLHAHDEIVCEVPVTDADAYDRLEHHMTTLAPWAEGLPIAAEGYEAQRYRK